MRRISKLCASVLLVSTLAVLASGQQKSPRKYSSSQAANANQDRCDRAFQAVQFMQISFCLPKAFKKLKDKCYGPNCLVFESDNSLFMVHTNEMFPIAEKNYPSYSDKKIAMESFDVWVWSYDTSGTFRRTFGARLIQLNAESAVVSFSLATNKQASEQVLFEKIIASTKYLERQ